MLSPAELERYSRHLSLPQVGPAGQEKLKQSSVLLVGVGGLGSPAALYLASAGVGRMGLVDFDRVDSSNLQRQVLYGNRDVGRLKVEAAADRLGDLNPHVDIRPYNLRLGASNALEICSEYDLILDGTDNFNTRYLVNDASVLLGKPNIYASVYRFDGQLSTFFPKQSGPCYRCLYPVAPQDGLVQNCAEGGVLGILPGIVGALQASEAIKWILGQGDAMLGRLLLFDALGTSFREIKTRKDPACPICGTQPTITQLSEVEVACAASVAGLDSQELLERLKSGEDLQLIDVRESWEWDLGNLSEFGACLRPVGEIASLGESLDRQRTTIVYCKSGARSAKAVQILQQQGFAKVLSLKGGYDAWKRVQS
jgi:molybdopterin/thiamine biosynthesis adenylyltransferase/rhodanese-related sulfurtransferase